MKRGVLLDTGPLVAFINGRDTYHEWTVLQWAQISPPFLTCEAVLSEACFLLRNTSRGQSAVLELLERGILSLPFRMDEHTARIAWLLNKYADVPMSLADACLVCMSEVFANSILLTVDDDFRVYRKNRRQAIATLSPPDR